MYHQYFFIIAFDKDPSCDKNFLNTQHLRIKRSLDSGENKVSHEIKFNFTAHNRLFQIRLRNDAHNVFAPDAEFESTEGPLSYSMNNIYSGDLADTPGTSVDGIITSNGYFDGHIVTPSENYYIEPLSRYTKDGFKRDTSSNFHSVIYKETDVEHPQGASFPFSSSSSPFSSPSTLCKSHELHLKRMLDSLKEHHRDKREDMMNESFKFESVILPRVDESPPKRASPPLKQTLSTTYQVKNWGDIPENIRHHFRRRSHARRKIDPKKTTCMLYLQADHLFYQEVGSEEAAIEIMTRHVQRVNSIYRPVDFDQDGKADNISFMIKRIKVHTLEALKDPKYRFPKNYGVEKFLELFSEENYDAFCLAYMFTYRDFEGGTLGLAWTGDLKNAGGVCERNGHYRGSLKSLNTGIITLLNYGKHVPPAVSHVTMAHEMGHNFGSPHDPEDDKQCVPGGEDGNYIMFARATSGDKKNNRAFSPCSLKIVKNVLKTKAQTEKGCFREPQEALCGNGVVEEGEECDCGWEEDCEEKCCWPQRSNFSPNQKPCTLRPHKMCSPTQGPCCNNQCEYTVGMKCRDDNGCRAESYCDGTASTCPDSIVKPNKTVCNKEFVCYKGECTGSICLAYGMESCQCKQGPDDPDTKACELCCKEPGEGNPCLSSFELNNPPFDVPDMFSKPGTPCNEYKGYCDVFQKCREVDPSGPLATLRKLLLSEESIETLRLFLVRHWYTVIFVGIAVLGLMGIIVRICGKKTPLVHRPRRRKRTIHHDNEDNVRQTGMDENEMQIHPEAIEPFVPIGKKVPLGYAAATLAANIGKRLVVHHPTEDREGVVDKEEVDDEAVQQQLRFSRLKTQNKRLSSSTVFAKYTGGKKLTGNNLRYRRKANPERFSLAASVTSLSKSFEKLDVVVAAARKRTRRKNTIDNLPTNKDQSKNKRKSSASKEITLAKIGRFKFTIEADNSEKQASNDKSKTETKARKSSKHKLDVKGPPPPLSAKQQRRSKNEDVAAYIRSLSVDNTVSPPKLPENPPTPPILEDIHNRSKDEVIVSKKPNPDRPLAKGPKRDYRLDLNAANSKFTRSISQPGMASNALDANGPSSAPVKQRHYSFVSDNIVPQLSTTKHSNNLTKKRSPDEGNPVSRSRRLGVVHKEALLLNIETPSTHVFDNPGYDGGGSKNTSQPVDKLSKLSSSLKKQLFDSTSSGKGVCASSGSKVNQYETMKNDDDEEDGEVSSSSTSISLSDISSKQRLSPPTQVQSLSEESSSSMELKEDEEEDSRQKVKRKRSISRQRILETCIANEEAEKLRSALETASKQQQQQQQNESNVENQHSQEDTVAFIGCESPT
ncbi:ADAM10 [Lepeophtheirus salmonis]|uniref:ADAM10 endopeptidase n=1 Tax=Lepeophtheirus salmonis TaxID=72036 RepID=A0A7R8CDV0_LEPSM|nr:ADAM10 [Lepeophtheirus salmonis]CAF2779722.1 ADAM10 [Lepeophtheirus salmonis]